MRRRTWSRPLALAMALALTVAACGGDDDDESGGDDGGAAPAGEPVAAPGFDGTTIRLGVITPTSGPVAQIGNPLTAGNQAYFDYVNTELGGVGGKYTIELDIRDSGYDPTKAGQEYAAIKDNVTMIAQLLGTPITNAVLEQLIDDEIMAAPASLDSFWVREPNLLPIGGPYQIQAINALNWYVTEGGGEDTQVCSLIQDDPYGEAGQAGLEFAAEELGIDIAEPVRFPAPPASAGDFSAQIDQLRGDDCEMVFLVATPSSTAPALTKAAQVQYAPQWIGQSPTWIGALGQSALAPYLQANFLVASEGVAYGDTSVEGMSELLRIREAYAPSQAPDVYFNFGVVQAMAVHALLERAVELGDLSRAGILEASEQLGTVDFGGLTGTYEYGPAEDRVPPTRSTMFKVDPANPVGLSPVEGAIDIEAPFAGDFEFTRVGE